jgi:predicted phage terminase large subunit-like protein
MNIAQSMSAANASSILNDWRLTPATMMARLDSEWIPARWLQYLSLKIAQTVARGNCGLLISAPPRHGKSMLSTIATPLWIMENFPGKNVVVATYGEELSTDFTRTVRDLIQQNQSLLNVRLRQDARRVTNILTTEGGGLKAVGLQGTITGRGADVLVIDDYIKNPKEAMSPTYLQDLWDWWRTVARTRLEPGAVVIILATRWVSNDLHGKLMKHQAETGRSFFEYVELPAIALANKPDAIGRQPGEVLFPERYDQESVEAIKDELGTRWFNAMFQQQPQDDDARMVDPAWFQAISISEFERLYDAMLDSPQKGSLQWVRAWDLASTKEAGDFTSGGYCLYNKETECFYIRNIARGQWSSNTVEEKFAQLTKIESQKNRLLNVRYRVGMEQEPGSSGKYTIKHFRDIIRAIEAETVLVEHPATTSKLLNAQPLLAAAEAGKVFVVVDRDHRDKITGWARNLYEELENFPEGDHDDQVDCLSQAYKMVTGKKPVNPTFGRKKTTNLPKEAREVIANQSIGVTFGRRMKEATVG